MNPSLAGNLYVALLHYPVRNKNGEVIASAVTNLDLHDIARVSRTYGVAKFFVVTPLDDQRQLVEKIKSHWTTGYGATYNPMRAEAFKRLTVKETLDDAVKEIGEESGRAPAIVMTSAKEHPDNVSFSFLRERLKEQDLVLALGTAWGLDKNFLNQVDYILEPVAKKSDYNHLSVRSAVSIMLDRLIE